MGFLSGLSKIGFVENYGRTYTNFSKLHFFSILYIKLRFETLERLKRKIKEILIITRKVCVSIKI